MTYKGKKQHTVDKHLMMLERIQMAIARACARSPWRTRCFEQALTAKMMTRRRGIASRVFFGISKQADKQMAAHAWVKSGDFVITGWQRINEYKVVAEF